MKRSRLAKFSLCVLLVPATSLAGQECVAALPASALTRVPVLIDTKPVDSASVAILPAADILTQILTERIRKPLGGDTGPLPPGESIASWRELGGSIVVTAHHDGTFTWKKNTNVASAFMKTDALDLIARALTESAAAGDRAFWPEGAKDDSLSFELSFATPAVRQGGKIEPLHVRVANPVFTLPMPWFETATMTKEPRIDYPIRSQSSRYEGKAILEFIVDSAGHVLPESIHEIWPEGVKRPVGDEAAYYRSFLAAAIRGLPTGEFKAAMIGGCAINQQVRQAFDFKLAQK